MCDVTVETKGKKASGNQTDPCEIEFAILLFFHRETKRKKNEKKIRENFILEIGQKKIETRSRGKVEFWRRTFFRVEKSNCI